MRFFFLSISGILSQVTTHGCKLVVSLFITFAFYVAADGDYIAACLFYCSHLELEIVD